MSRHGSTTTTTTTTTTLADFFCILCVVGSRVSTCNSFEMRVDHVTIWVHADGAHEDEPHADEVE